MDKAAKAAKKATAKKATPAKKAGTKPTKAAPAKTSTAAKKATPARKATPAKKATAAMEATPANTAPTRRSEPEPTLVETLPGLEPAPDGTAPQATTPKPPSATTQGPQATTPEPRPEPRPEPPLTAQEPLLTAPPAAPGGGRSWLVRVPTNPGYAPELLALAAVDALGPRARDWVGQIRATYPAASADGVARLAVRRFTRVAAAGGAAAVAAGAFAPVAEAAALAWAHAGLVLHLAAAYDLDPTDRERAVDLLVLTRVHPSPELARAAVESAGDEVDDVPYSAQRATEAAWRLAAPLAAQTAGWLAVRMVARLVPGCRPLVAGAGHAAGAERLAHRAIAHYRALTPKARAS